MPTDIAHPFPPPGAPAPSDDSVQQEEALFRALLHRVRASSDKVQLQDRSDAALRLILNRDSDQSLREELIADITHIVGVLPDDVGDGPGRLALTKAAEVCLAILRTAEQRRVTPPPPPPPKVTPVAAATSAASYERRAQEGASHLRSPPHPHSHSHPPEETPSSRSAWIMGAVLLAILAGGVAIGLRGRGEPAVRPLVAQIEAAAHGNVPATNIFGGALTSSVQGGRTVVTAEGIPAGECVSSGWDLVHKGLLTVNGVTPNRVSAAKLNELCHDEETAILIWSPKATAP